MKLLGSYRIIFLCDTFFREISCFMFHLCGKILQTKLETCSKQKVFFIANRNVSRWTFLQHSAMLFYVIFEIFFSIWSATKLPAEVSWLVLLTLNYLLICSLPMICWICWSFIVCLRDFGEISWMGKLK